MTGLITAAVVLALTLAAVAGSVASASAGPARGPVDVLYAGSLVEAMTAQLGPAFDRATGYDLVGFSAGSDDLAADIKDRKETSDVLVSAGTQLDEALEGVHNGDWVSWYAEFATSKLVLGYDPDTRFARQLETEPWYRVVGEKGFLVGRTDPATDPKGTQTAEALSNAARSAGEPALRKLGTEKSDVFSEETLVGRLEAGQLDAAFFYDSEAVAAHIPTVPLTGQKLAATYTLTVVKHAPHAAGAVALVKYLLSPPAAAVLQKDGFTQIHPARVTGTGIPAALGSVLSGS